MNARILALIFFLFLFSPVDHAADLPPLPSPAKHPSDLHFKHAAFTFARVQYSSGGPGRGSWTTDFPDADLNFTYRFHQATGLKVEKHQTVKLNFDSLKAFPFIYIAEGGTLDLSDHEVDALRRYLLGGGFLMVDDFWGEQEWASLAAQMKRVFPELTPVDLPLEHPIFHCFYELKEKPQVPNIHLAITKKDEGITWERTDGREAHYRGLIDSNGRLIAVFCHNTDLGDGWERESEDAWYGAEFSRKRAFPIGLNIVVYALTQ